MRREIDAPDKEWLTLRELSRWLGIGPRALKIMVANGEIGPPAKMGHKTRMWSWRDAVAINIMLGWRRQEKEGAPKRP